MAAIEFLADVGLILAEIGEALFRRAHLCLGVADLCRRADEFGVELGAFARQHLDFGVDRGLRFFGALELSLAVLKLFLPDLGVGLLILRLGKHRGRAQARHEQSA